MIILGLTPGSTYTITDEEFEKLLQDVHDFPSSIDNPGLGLDFSVLPTVDDIDTMTSLLRVTYYPTQQRLFQPFTGFL